MSRDRAVELQKRRIEETRVRQYIHEELGVRRRKKRQAEIAELIALARIQAASLADERLWIAGVVAYWAEGSKRDNQLSFSNSDPEMIQLFIAWAKEFLELGNERFTISLHLHSGQDENERKRYWGDLAGLPLWQFRKTYIKPEGTGHRKNRLYNGTASIRVTRSTDLFHQVTGWIDFVRDVDQLR